MKRSDKIDSQFLRLIELLEIIHAENLTIYNSILLLGTIEDGTRMALLNEWDKRFQNIRRDFWENNT